MANPSDTGPSGIGSEVLRRVQFNGLNNVTTTLLTVGTDMIVTVLSITVSNISGTAATCNIHIAPDGSGQCTVYNGPSSLHGNSTFVWNDKIVLVETDLIKVECGSDNHDIYMSYIEQEFA